MTFNPLEEKGMPLEKQLRNWHQIVAKPYKKQEVDWNYYTDYLEMCQQLKRRLTSRGCLFPNDVKVQHDNLSRIIREKEELEMKKKEQRRSSAFEKKCAKLIRNTIWRKIYKIYSLM